MKNVTAQTQSLLVVCLLSVAVVASMIAIVMILLWQMPGPLYHDDTVAKLPSPTGEWTAWVHTYAVEGSLGTSYVSDLVELIPARQPDKPIHVLNVENGGEDHPRIAWTAPTTLRVTVPNLTPIYKPVRHVDGVDIEIGFDPDDPAARAAWLERVRRGTTNAPLQTDVK